MSIIFADFPKVNTSHARELQLAMQFWAKRYDEISYKRNEVWQLYDDAIDSQESTQTIREIGEVAKAIEFETVEAWKLWKESQRNYIALMN